MSVRKMTTYLSTAAVALALGALVTSSTAWAGGDKFECRAEDDTGRSMDAKFEDIDGRFKFSASIETAADDPDLTVSVLVGGIQVDTITLASDATGKVGEVNYDTNPEDDDPFPFDPTSVGGGTNVEVGGVDCDLQED
jgi:hypothetical protein